VTKHYRKMIRRQQTHLGSMGRKCDMVRWHDDVGQRRDDTEEGKERKRGQLG
jgi:hypothetical protein